MIVVRPVLFLRLVCGAALLLVLVGCAAPGRQATQYPVITATPIATSAYPGPVTASPISPPPAQPSATQPLIMDATPTALLLPANTPTSAASLTPLPSSTAAPTNPPFLVGTPLPDTLEPITEANLPKIRLLAEWGRGRVDDLAYAPDGSRLAVCTSLGVLVYDARTLTNPQFLHSGPAARASWSLQGDQLAVDVADAQKHVVQIWDMRASPTAQQPAMTLVTESAALALAFRDANTLDVLTRTNGGANFQQWNLATRKRTIISLIGGETATIAAFSGDGTFAATHGQKGPVRLWRLRDGVNLATTPEDGIDAGALAFAPQGNLLAVAYPDQKKDFLNTNQVRVWNLPSAGSGLIEPAYTLSDPTQTEGMEDALLALAWSADGTYLAAGSADHQVHIWKTTPGPVYRRIAIASLPLAINFAPTSTAQDVRFAVGSLEVWAIAPQDQSAAAQPLAATDDFLPAINDMQFSPAAAQGSAQAEGSLLALAGYGSIDFRSVRDGTMLRQITGMHGPVNSLAFSPNGNLIVAACQDGTTRLYRVRDGRYLEELGAPTFPLLAAAFSSNGFWIASSGEDMKVRIFRLEDGLQIDAFNEPYAAYQLAFSPNSDQIAALTTSGLTLRSVKGGELQQTTITLQGIVGGVGLTDMAYSPGQEHLALVGNDLVRVIDPADRSEQYTLYEPHGTTGAARYQPWALAFSPDNAFLAVGWSSGEVTIYWAQDGSRLRSWQAHPESIRRLAFSANSHMLATLGAEGVIRVWGVAP